MNKKQNAALAGRGGDKVDGTFCGCAIVLCFYYSTIAARRQMEW